MSIVGTRPPLISETNLYEPHHKASYGRRKLLQPDVPQGGRNQSKGVQKAMVTQGRTPCVFLKNI